MIVNAIERKNLLGVPISIVDYDSATQAIVNAAESGRPMGVSALAVHGVMTGVLNHEHRYRLNQLEMLVPDGQPVRWALNLLHGTGLRDRVYGPNLMLRILEEAEKKNLPVCLFGGSERLLRKLQGNLMARFPALKIAATIPSKFRTITDVEKKELVSQIRNCGAKITFVGLGCPRQEVWAYEFREVLAMPVLAVGAAFNFHAGELAQAPAWMQKAGLEWFYRFTREPIRLWQRYLVLNPLYLSLVTLQLLRLNRFDASHDKKPEQEILYG